MPRTTVYSLVCALGGAETSLASCTIRAPGRIVSIGFTGFVQDNTEAYAGFGAECTKNIPAGGSAPACNAVGSITREFLLGCVEGVAAGAASGVNINAGPMPCSIPVAAGDVLNLGTYAVDGNPLLTPGEGSIRANVYVLEN